VDLEAAPYVWRVGTGADGWPVTAHTGEPAQVLQVWLDDRGRLYLWCRLESVGEALGLVHTLDMTAAADAVEAGRWTPQECRFEEMPRRFGYVLRPRA
jgi:hypothetical protein